MRLNRTAGLGMVAALWLAAAGVAGGLVVAGVWNSGTPTSGCALHYVQTTDSWVCQGGAKPPPPPPPSVGCAMDSGYWVCAGSGGAAPKAERKIGTPTSSSSSTAALEVGYGLGAGPPSPPFPHPFMIAPGKPQLAGQPAPQPRPVLLMQLAAGLATAPASPTATVLISDWPDAGKGKVSVSVYQGDTVDACSSPPLRTETAAALPGAPGVSSATFAGLIAGRYEVQASFVGPVGLMSTPCGGNALKVVAAPRSAQ